MDTRDEDHWSRQSPSLSLLPSISSCSSNRVKTTAKRYVGKNINDENKSDEEKNKDFATDWPDLSERSFLSKRLTRRTNTIHHFESIPNPSKKKKKSSPMSSKMKKSWRSFFGGDSAGKNGTRPNGKRRRLNAKEDLSSPDRIPLLDWYVVDARRTNKIRPVRPAAD